MRSPDRVSRDRLSPQRGVQCIGVDLALAVPGMETEQPQDAQIIFADARRRVADETHTPVRQIFDDRRR